MATDEGHFLLEGVDGGEGVDLEVLAERREGGATLRGDDVVGDYFPVGEGHFREVLQEEEIVRVARLAILSTHSDMFVLYKEWI